MAPRRAATESEGRKIAIVNPTVRRPTGQQTDRPTDKQTGKPTDQPAGRPADQQTERQTDRPTDRPTDWPTDRGTDRPVAPPPLSIRVGEISKNLRLSTRLNFELLRFFRDNLKSEIAVKIVKSERKRDLRRNEIEIEIA